MACFNDYRAMNVNPDNFPQGAESGIEEQLNPQGSCTVCIKCLFFWIGVAVIALLLLRK